jgi:hypothetical protein
MAGAFSWLAVYPNGSTQERWVDGVEQKPRPEAREFHLLPNPEAMAHGARPYSIFLRRNEELVYFKRAHADGVSFNGGPPIMIGAGLDGAIVLGVRAGRDDPEDRLPPVVYFLVLPDGRVEISTDREHVTRYERHETDHPLRFYEAWPLDEIPGWPGEEPRWPGEYDRTIDVPDISEILDPRKIDPPLPPGFDRNAKEFEADAVVTESRPAPN